MEQPTLPHTLPIEIKYQSDSICNLAKALCETQKTKLLAITDSKNPFFNSKYADLSSNWSAARDPLTANGLSISQTTEPFPNGVIVVTTLMHKSGEWIKGRLAWEVVPDKHGKRTSQGLLALITYLRRAGVSAIVGTCPEDDDGESTMNRGTSPPPCTPSNQKKSTSLPGNVETTGLEKIKKPGDKQHTELDADERVMVDYTMPGEDSFAMQQLKEFRPTATILNNEKTRFKVGKFTTEISEDGKQIWIDAPKFGRPDFDADACVPCLIAGLVREYGVPFIEGKYGLKFTSEVENGK